MDRMIVRYLNEYCRGKRAALPAWRAPRLHSAPVDEIIECDFRFRAADLSREPHLVVDEPLGGRPHLDVG
jgi:hypothetical protein